MNFENNVYSFLKELKQFDYEISYTDHIWNIIFPDKKKKWHYLRCVKYKETYYISHIDGEKCCLEIILDKSIAAAESFGSSVYYDGRDDLPKAWGDLITAARIWLKRVNKDWVKTQKEVQENYPLDRRLGYISNALVRVSLPDMYRIDKKLGKANCKKFIKLVEEGYFHKNENYTVNTLTANKFFEYCKIAYIAAAEKPDYIDKSLTGKEMYQRYADGRHEGLLDIDPNSKKEFANWLDGKHPKKTSGGHPWEIKRGGNTTHINLYVSRPSFHLNESFEITLAGASIGRLNETVRMFLAIHDAGLPITIADPEGIRKRILAQDNVGIIPKYESLHRANQQFREDEYVYDVLYFHDLGRSRNKLKTFITWKPLPLLTVQK